MADRRCSGRRYAGQRRENEPGGRAARPRCRLAGRAERNSDQYCARRTIPAEERARAPFRSARHSTGRQPCPWTTCPPATSSVGRSHVSRRCRTSSPIWRPRVPLRERQPRPPSTPRFAATGQERISHSESQRPSGTRRDRYGTRTRPAPVHSRHTRLAWRIRLGRLLGSSADRDGACGRTGRTLDAHHRLIEISPRAHSRLLCRVREACGTA